MTYTEEFNQSLTVEAYKLSPVFWHCNIRHAPSQSEICKRDAPRKPLTDQTLSVNVNLAKQMGFSSMTLGGLGGVDCYCGWWSTSTECRIPDNLCTALVQILGFGRICIGDLWIHPLECSFQILQIKYCAKGSMGSE
jgi:hypothetical protein